ncbi:pickpocket protein 19-like [Lutzomyia longipalpis]|uniref:pickpocket protein 19-like n=1 Tax=Lutzomyia longipalpis TaxID=7200 RepID=UPI0024846F4C|nr:pickpocket protein 19-like [Lutzomyia longipalpis]
MKLRLRNSLCWQRYSRNSTVHGIKYLVDDDLHPAERIFWFILLALAVFGTVNVSLLLSRRFSSSPLATVIESTIYPVSEIPYPAVTICTSNRINWSHVDDAVGQYAASVGGNLANMTVTLKYFLAEGIERMLSDEFDLVRNFPQNNHQSHRELEHINFGQLLHEISPRCSNIFKEPCWWRNKYVNCCTIFVHQVTTYGHCFAFNALYNEEAARHLNETDWPWRTSNYGDWSGLRVTLRNPQARGIGVIIHHPIEWPQTAKFIPTGSIAIFSITPTFSYSSSSVGRFTPTQRGCLLESEISDEETVMSLPGLKYHLENCIAECRQRYMVQYCNCTVDFMYPTGSYPICNATGLRCIGNFVGKWRKYTVLQPHIHTPKDTTLCATCLPQCRHVTYSIATESNTLPAEDRDLITLDIHFRYATMVKYRTYVVYEFLDLIVAFGGIAGLFLGSSLLSIVEILYYILCGIFRANNIPS